MTPDRLAFIAGETWLASGVTRAPTENDLAEVASRLSPESDSLAVVKACVDVADAVEWVLGCRKLAADRPDLLPPEEVPTW